MRRTLLAAGFAMIALAVVAINAGDALFIQVRSTELRSGPGFLSSIEEHLDFGAELTYVNERADWIQVTATDSGETGWVHRTSIESDKSTQMQLQGEQTTRTVTAREVALAGRGFSENLEDDFGKTRELDFSQVDAIEAEEVDPEAIVSFVQAANLRVDFLQEAQQ